MDLYLYKIHIELGFLYFTWQPYQYSNDYLQVAIEEIKVKSVTEPWKGKQCALRTQHWFNLPDSWNQSQWRNDTMLLLVGLKLMRRKWLWLHMPLPTWAVSELQTLSAMRFLITKVYSLCISFSLPEYSLQHLRGMPACTRVQPRSARKLSPLPAMLRQRGERCSASPSSQKVTGRTHALGPTRGYIDGFCSNLPVSPPPSICAFWEHPAGTCVKFLPQRLFL